MKKLLSIFVLGALLLPSNSYGTQRELERVEDNFQRARAEVVLVANFPNSLLRRYEEMIASENQANYNDKVLAYHEQLTAYTDNLPAIPQNIVEGYWNALEVYERSVRGQVEDLIKDIFYICYGYVDENWEPQEETNYLLEVGMRFREIRMFIGNQILL